MSEADLLVEVETAPDFEATARLARQSFDGKDTGFSADYLKWLYQSGFGGDTTIVSASKAGDKIGQMVLLWQDIRINGQTAKCAQLVDLFVIPAHRSYGVTRKIYAVAAQVIRARPGSPVIAMPNPKATPLNKRFLKLSATKTLDIRAGIASPFFRGAKAVSLRHDDDRGIDATAGLEDYLAGGGDRLLWTCDALRQRLANPKHSYAIHRSGNVCMITSMRTIRSIPVFLICALFCRQGQSAPPGETAALLWAAAKTHKWPLFVYVGFNTNVDPPGQSLPDRFRPSPMILQTGLFPDTAELSRFEALDFDFA
jgi:predicted N-acetyltransferase YhbS